ncbi:2-hydroxymuconate tautomerase [Ureibacillus sp. 179-F W5.1 NHS]|uniref:Tautomerase n=2 Tax=Bacillales TaxID=1385 RepID=A0A3M8H7Q9_9BACI|nr:MULTISPECIES: 2-hydroxymuconate tautomerase [Bacillales]MBD8025517.1 4-oxalocrotonate tautomerase [Ureibacillus galli]RNC98319.1 4-oxalocrotonate tautomerase [Lysinibacillus halotolerans]
MPIVTVKLLEGRTDEQKKALVEKVTEAIVETVNAKPEAVTIVLEEMSKNHYATGGVRAIDK